MYHIVPYRCTCAPAQKLWGCLHQSASGKISWVFRCTLTVLVYATVTTTWPVSFNYTMHVLLVFILWPWIYCYRRLFRLEEFPPLQEILGSASIRVCFSIELYGNPLLRSLPHNFGETHSFPMGPPSGENLLPKGLQYTIKPLSSPPLSQRWQGWVLHWLMYSRPENVF